MRVVSPDKYQAAGMIALLREFGWTYIVTMTSDNIYSRNGIIHITREAAKAGICILHQWEISHLKDNDVDEIVGQLIKNTKIKVIVSFMAQVDVFRVLSAIKRLGNIPTFIFIFSDSLSDLALIETVANVAENSFSFSLSTGDMSILSSYYGTASTYLKNDQFYYKKFWKDEYGCSMENGILGTCFSDPPAEFKVALYVPLLIDSVYAFAHGLDNLIKAQNGHQQLNRSEIRTCITGSLLLESLSKIVFMKDGSYINFDKRGDSKTDYIIKQIQSISFGGYVMETVGIYETENDSLKFQTSKLSWSGHFDGYPPESLCSQPCHKGEYYVREDIYCCWKCIRCELNEITVQNGSVCTPCPTFTWPDQDSFTKCVFIEAEFAHAGDPHGFILILLAGLGAFSCFLVVIFVYKYRKRKLIKASGISLSWLVLFGDITAFLSVPLLVTKASTGTCYLNHFAFHMSFYLSYAPLLCKANRICRIFASGKMGTLRPKFISTKSQVIAASILCAFQVGMYPVKCSYHGYLISFSMR